MIDSLRHLQMKFPVDNIIFLITKFYKICSNLKLLQVMGIATSSKHFTQYTFGYLKINSLISYTTSMFF